MRVLLPVLLAVLLAGCSGFSISPRQDKADAAAFAKALAAAPDGGRFRARELLGKGWTRMWVFPGGTDTQVIEDRIGIPFPQSSEEPNVEDGLNYVVFDDGEVVVSAFVPSARVEVRPECVAGDRRAVGPDQALTIVAASGGRARRVSTPARATACG